MQEPPTLGQTARQKLLTLLGEAFRFGLVGVAGYIVDVAVLMLLVRLGLDPFTARVPSFIAAASTTWYLNRRFTFQRPTREPGSASVARPMHRQWALFVVLMLPGAALNYGTYALLVAKWDLAWTLLAIPVAAGALAGMSLNFLVSKTIVFRN